MYSLLLTTGHIVGAMSVARAHAKMKRESNVAAIVRNNGGVVIATR